MNPDDIDVQEAPAVPLDDIEVDPDSQVLSVETDDDGGVKVTFGEPKSDEDDTPSDHGDNLAEDMEEVELGRIASDLLEAIRQDDDSRREWISRQQEAIDLLGLTTQQPQDGSAEGMSTIRHPLLTEALLRFHANACGELLPVDGPVKVRNDGSVDDPTATPDGIQSADDLADALERDINHYLTVTSKGYVEDTERAIWWTGLSGMSFKKLYHHPLKRRPVSESVDAADIIVPSYATSIEDADRVTHQIRLSQTALKRMQVAGAYRDVDLTLPDLEDDSADHQAADDVQGTTTATAVRDDDRRHTIYEVYCELDLAGYEHVGDDREKTGLPLPYKVSIDRSSQTILEIRRNWKEGDDQYEARKPFVAFTFITTGLGFYGIGLYHILGNTTNALTAAYRILLDAGMLSNFPGGMIDAGATKQERVTIRAGVGEFVKINNPNGGDIRQAIMPFPYKGPDPAMMQLAGDIAQTGQRIGGTAEINVGEGRQDAPVGTTLALIEQAGKVLDAVHKHLHRAQSREFQLLVELFREDPDAFWRSNKKPATVWDRATFIKALDDYDLVPVADPNTSSHMQRLARMQAVTQMAMQAPPGLFNPEKIAERNLRLLQIPDFEELLGPGMSGPQQPQVAPDKMLAAQARMLDAQTKAQGLAADQQQTIINAQTKRAEINQKSADNIRSLRDQAADRAANVQIAHLKAVASLAAHDNRIGHEREQADLDRDHDVAKTLLGHALQPPAPANGLGGA